MNFLDLFRKKNKIELVDIGNEVQLRYNGYTYSAYNKQNLFIGAYWDFFSALPLLFKSTKILIIGLGAGTIAFQIKSLFGNSVTIDGVEASKEVVAIAKKLKKAEYNIIEDDGYHYLAVSNNTYDIIILDAYVNDQIPSQFLSEDFVNLAFNKTSASGVFAINYALTPSLIGKEDEFLKLLSKYWPKIYLLDHPGRSYNEIIIASKIYNMKQILSAFSKEYLSSINKDLVGIVEAYLNAREYEKDQ
jgi:hypothetical protein